MMENSLVSIIMPSYNTAKYIGESIDSVIEQTYKNWELIIVDDCSTDNTDEVVAQYDDSRIIYLKNEKNSGAAVSRNKALRVAKGEWIAFLDSDDLWDTTKLEKQLKFMIDNGYKFSCTGRDEIDEDSNSLGRITTSPKHITPFGMYLYCWVGCLAVMYHSPTVGLIQIDDIKKNNDYAMWLKVIKKCDCYCFYEVLAHYRVRKKSISHDKLLRLIKSHYDMFRLSENMNSIMSFVLTIGNVFFGICKKIVYVKSERL